MSNEIEFQVVNKEINEVSILEQREIPITLEQSAQEIIFSNRDWLLGGKSFSWSYRLSSDGTKVLMQRW